MSDGISIGALAPSVSAPLVRPDGETEPVSLESLYEDRAILLTFYTNDFSPVASRSGVRFGTMSGLPPTSASMLSV